MPKNAPESEGLADGVYKKTVAESFSLPLALRTYRLKIEEMEEKLLHSRSPAETKRLLKVFEEEMERWTAILLKGTDQFFNTMGNIGYEDGVKDAQTAMRKRGVHFEEEKTD